MTKNSLKKKKEKTLAAMSVFDLHENHYLNRQQLQLLTEQDASGSSDSGGVGISLTQGCSPGSCYVKERHPSGLSQTQSL